MELDLQKAKELISDSLGQLEQNKGRLKATDIEAEVMNVTCLYLFKKYGNRIQQGHDNARIMQVMPNNYFHFSDDVIIFIQAAGSIHPNIFSPSKQDNYVGLIIKNASWTGMWDFLKDYYKNNHNTSISK